MDSADEVPIDPYLQRIAKANDNHEAAKAKRKAVEDKWKAISDEE